MKIVAVQIDLGRQKEKIEFIKSFVDNAKKWGYNAIILYLECCVRTSVTPFLDEDDSYSLNELKSIVDYIENSGLTAIPAFENFYHVEKLLRYKEAENLSEFTDERTQGRGWMPERFKRGAVGCTTNPDFNKLFDKYITEVCSLFHGEYIHAGLDEVFEFAECPRCKALRKTGITKKDIFFSQVMHDYDLIKSMGKTMLMWDDFFEYYDIVADLPRDIILCHWNYGFIGSETKGHWTNRVRKDWLSVYDRLGFKYIFCAYGSNASSTYNVDTLTDYALKHNPTGAILTIWERAAGFYNGIYPLIALCGGLWNGKIKTCEDRVNTYAQVVGNAEIARTLLDAQVLTSCLMSTNIGEKAEDDNFAKFLYCKSLKSSVEKLRTFLSDGTISENARDILLDIYDFVYEKYLICKINSLGHNVFDKYEKENFGNGAADFSQIFAVLDDANEGFEEINRNCEYLWKKYRDGIRSSLGLMEETIFRRKTSIEKIKKSISDNRGCGILYLDTVTPDGFGSPKMKISVKYAGEEESVAYFGSVKPESVTFDLGGTATVRLAIKNKPIEFVKAECFGEDSIFVSNLRYLVNGEKYSVCKVEKTGGRVINGQNITRCDTTFAELGYSSGVDHLENVSLCKKGSGVKLYFDKII